MDGIGSISLYPYQAEMVRRIGAAFSACQSVMVQMPTGTGKTHVIAAVVKEYASEGSQVWVVAHRRELVTQIRDTLGLYLDKAEMRHVEVRSVQWLSRHAGEMKAPPSLIVIDEAHHALAATYSFLMRLFPEAKKLGVTATPYRLSGKGFTDLFDTLLTSRSVYDFMAEGRLCLYDYYTVREDDEELRLIRSIRRHGTDGDYDPRELDKAYNRTKAVEHLYESFKKYAPERKGFVYAMSIGHAENIARYYREKGIKATAVSSHTPKEERRRTIERFREGGIQVLVSVDLFSEGIDVPDADFIQLARPTLSLAKYLQMTGRGLRTANGKDYCVIIDNVGNYWNFGLPSDNRQWETFFHGYDKNEVSLFHPTDYSAPRRYLQYFTEEPTYFNAEGERDMLKAEDHSVERCNIETLRRYRIVKDKDGRMGISDSEGGMLLPCEYSLSIDRNGIVSVDTAKENKIYWLDLHNGLQYQRKPRCCLINGFPVALTGDKAYPRVRSRFVTGGTCLDLANNLPFPFYDVHRWGDVVFVKEEEAWHAYHVIEEDGHGAMVCEDEGGELYGLESPDDKPTPIKDRSESARFFAECGQRRRLWMMRAKAYVGTYVPEENVEKIFRKCATRDCGSGIWEVTKLDGVKYWIDTSDMMRYSVKPERGRIGIMTFLSFGDTYFLPRLRPGKPLHKWEIRANQNACLVDGVLYRHINPQSSYISDYKIVKIAADHSYMDVVNGSEVCRVLLQTL